MPFHTWLSPAEGDRVTSPKANTHSHTHKQKNTHTPSHIGEFRVISSIMNKMRLS